MITASHPGTAQQEPPRSLQRIKEDLVEAGLQASVDSRPEELNFVQLINYAGSEESFGVGKLRLDLVEFELRHLKEHVDKLKFNYLEMCTKRQFMGRLLDSDEWGHLYNGAIWTPADIKALEKQSEPTKAALVDAKGKTGDLESELSRLTEHLCNLNEMVGQKLSTASELETEIEVLKGEISKLRPESAENTSPTPMRSVEELQTIIDDQIIYLEKRRTSIEARRAAIASLNAQLQSQQSELAAVSKLDADLSCRLQEKEKAERGDEGRAAYNIQLAALAEWYKAVLQVHASISGIQRIELVRPDYLLVTLCCVGNNENDNTTTGAALLPVHLRVCPATGKLMAAQIGSTSSTPRKGQWREVIETAVETGNIAGLVRQIHTALAKS